MEFRMVVQFEKVSGGEGLKAKTASEWKPGETYLGWLLEVKEIESSYGKNKVYKFQNGDAEGYMLEGNTDLMGSGGLNHQLDKCSVGDFIQVVAGEVKLNPATKRKFVEFTVSRSKTPMEAPKGKSKNKKPTVDEEFSMDWDA